MAQCWSSSHSDQDDESRHAERRGVDAQRLVRVENGDDDGASVETENLAGLVGDVADGGSEHENIAGQYVSISAVRAAENGTPVSTMQDSRTHSVANGMLGTAVSPIVPTRNRSQAIMTRRRGSRSARPESSGPPGRTDRH